MYWFRNLLTRFPKTFKTIPTSYLDSLSYEDQLNWLCAIILELKDQIDGGGSDYDEDINNLKQAVAGLQQAVETNTAAIATLVEQLAQTNQNVQNLQTGIANLGQQIHSLTNRVSALESYIVPGGAASMTESVLKEIQLPEIYTGTFVPAEL